MTDCSNEDLPSEPWAVSAAYLYTLDLDGPALAWEYLRRHQQYRVDWVRRRGASFERWGLRQRRRPASRCARSPSHLDRHH